MNGTPSVFALALGDDFARLHPRLQERFGFTSADRRACIGTGVMKRIWRGGAYTAPFLRLGAARNILFPETGTDVPFTIENYAYLDHYGRETLTFVRSFDVRRDRRRRFDATMVYDPTRGRVVDFLGTHQHLAVELDVQVDGEGALRIRSGAQRFCERWLKVGLPTGLSGEAQLHESFDDETGAFSIRVAVSNPLTGPIFGYEGSFTVAYPETEQAPAAAKPLREKALR